MIEYKIAGHSLFKKINIESMLTSQKQFSQTNSYNRNILRIVYDVVHKIPMTWTVYLTIYVQILGKSFGKFIWDFIGNLALIYINVWSNGLILKCQSHRKITPQ